MFGMHRDVLDAVPGDDASRGRLVDELKSRGNAAFKAQRYPEADVLYSKALEHAPTLHTLYGNRSASRLPVGKTEEALADAEKAIELDASWGKGFFRKGQALAALSRFHAATAAFEAAAELAPADKKLRAQVEKTRKVADEAGPDPKPGAAAKPAAAKTAAKKPAAKRAAAAKPAAAAAAGEKASSGTVATNGTMRGEHVRGYKVRADGTKTTFFNNDLTDEAKALIGDIAPKKIDATAASASGGGGGGGGAGAGEGGAKQSQGSEWNFAGTFEEKDRTAWVKQRLAKVLGECGAPIVEAGGYGGSIDVEKVEGLEGDASIVSVKGKRKHVASFEFEVHWSAVLEREDDAGDDDDASPSSASGVIFFPDFQSDALDDIEWEKKGVTQVEDPGSRKAVDAGIKALAAAVSVTLRDFIAEYREL